MHSLLSFEKTENLGASVTVEPLTISQAINKLTEKGYVADFFASEKGLCVRGKEYCISAHDLVIDKTYRFEGETDLDEEAIIFALSTRDKSIKGTYLVAFGPKIDPLDSEMVQHLSKLSNENK